MKKILFCFLVFFSLVSCQQNSPKLKATGKNFGQIAIMQGPTSSTQARFVLAVEKNEKVQIDLLSHSGEKLLRVQAKDIQWRGSDWKLVSFRFVNLKPGTQYGLRVSGYSGNWSDTRRFRTFSKQEIQLRLAVVSCMRDDLKGFGEIWAKLEKQKPQALFMIGDNTYADLKIGGLFIKMTANRLWNRHMETRNKLDVFRWENLVPVYATWDDHDYGVNDGDRNFHLKEEGAKIFSSFFPMNLPEKGFSKGPGVARQVKLANENFLFLDNRSFRSPKNLKKNRAHFGDKQKTWIFSKLQKNKLNWLISGDQFFGGYHPYDSYQGQKPRLFKKFLKSLRKTKAPVIFVSGDRHMSEIMEIPKKHLGYKTYEVTSSPIHSSVYPGASYQYKNPIRSQAISGKWNFVIFDIQKTNNGYTVPTKSMGVGETYFRQTLQLNR